MLEFMFSHNDDIFLQKIELCFYVIIMYKKMATIYIDEKIGYCEVNEKTEPEIKEYLIDEIIMLELKIADGTQKLVDMDNIRKTHKKYSIQELKGIVGDLKYYLDKNS